MDEELDVAGMTNILYSAIDYFAGQDEYDSPQFVEYFGDESLRIKMPDGSSFIITVEVE